MEIGKDEETLLQVAYRQKGPVSERIKNSPELLPGLQFYVDIFNLLTNSRQITQGGISCIPYSEISRFCQDEDIEGELREDVFFLIGKMDQFYVEWQGKSLKAKMEADMKAAKSKSKPARRR